MGVESTYRVCFGSSRERHTCGGYRPWGRPVGTRDRCWVRLRSLVWFYLNLVGRRFVLFCFPRARSRRPAHALHFRCSFCLFAEILTAAERFAAAGKRSIVTSLLRPPASPSTVESPSLSIHFARLTPSPCSHVVVKPCRWKRTHPSCLLPRLQSKPNGDNRRQRPKTFDTRDTTPRLFSAFAPTHPPTHPPVFPSHARAHVARRATTRSSTSVPPP